MTIKEKNEFLRENLPDRRFEFYCKLDNARALLHVWGAITDSENRKVQSRLEKKALKEASEVRKNAICQ